MAEMQAGVLAGTPKGPPRSHDDLKNLRTTYCPNRTTAKTITTVRMGPLPKSRAATCQEGQGSHKRGRHAGDQGSPAAGRTLTQPPFCAIHRAMQYCNMQSTTSLVTLPRKPDRPCW